ncbi:MAG: PAS domain S-box protein [Geobacteraceae bacterium]|nr:PAS domain S-box protein [Geobacteraceae bacterium]
MQRFIDDQTEKDLQYSLKFAKNQFSARQELVVEALKLSTVTPSFREIFQKNDHAELRNAIYLWAGSLDFLEMLTVLDSRQNVIARINGRTDHNPFLQTELITTVFDRKQPIITTEIVSHEQYCLEVKNGVCQSLSDNRDVMVQLIVLPLKNDSGDVIGAVVAGDDVNKDPHLPYQQQKVFGKTVEMLVTQMGEQIASTMTESAGISSILENRVLQALKSGYSFSGKTVLNGRQYEMIAEPIHNHKGEFIGSIAVALGVDRFSGPRNENYTNLIICGLLSLGLIFILAYFTARQFAAPMKRISDAVNALEEGDFSIKVPESGITEFKSLGEAFNKMAETLSERDLMITAQNSELVALNEELKKRAIERFGELESETALQKSMLASIADGMIVTDGRRIIIEINPAAEKLLGISAAEMTGAPIAKICRECGLDELDRLVSKSTTRSISDKEAGITVKHNRRSLRFTVTVLSYKKDGEKGLLMGVRDVTTDGELDRLKSGFIAKISHELKTPLTSMQGSLQYILKKGKWLTGVEREMLSVCLRNTERLTSLVAGIIELSRIEAGQISFLLRPLQIGEVVLYALEEIKGAALIKNISVVNDVPMDLPKVIGDYGRLIQVMSNLLSNAVKFSPENSVITLSAATEDSILGISVADDGKGIPEEDRGALFSTFQQMGRPEDGEFCGSGLGLAISREIMEIHGGTISYTPGTAGGNVFIIKVPIYGEVDGIQQNTDC